MSKRPSKPSFSPSLENDNCCVRLSQSFQVVGSTIDECNKLLIMKGEAPRCRTCEIDDKDPLVTEISCVSGSIDKKEERYFVAETKSA
jgi:hypothetical protein